LGVEGDATPGVRLDEPVTAKTRFGVNATDGGSTATCRNTIMATLQLRRGRKLCFIRVLLSGSRVGLSPVRQLQAVVQAALLITLLVAVLIAMLVAI